MGSTARLRAMTAPKRYCACQNTFLDRCNRSKVGNSLRGAAATARCREGAWALPCGYSLGCKCGRAKPKAGNCQQRGCPGISDVTDLAPHKLAITRRRDNEIGEVAISVNSVIFATWWRLTEEKHREARVAVASFSGTSLRSIPRGC